MVRLGLIPKLSAIECTGSCSVQVACQHACFFACGSCAVFWTVGCVQLVFRPTGGPLSLSMLGVGPLLHLVDCVILSSIFPGPQQTFFTQKSVFGAGLLEAFSAKVQFIGLCLISEIVNFASLALPLQARFPPGAVWRGRFIVAVDAEVLLLGHISFLLKILPPVFGFLFPAGVAGQSVRGGRFLSAVDAYVSL